MITIPWLSWTNRLTLLQATCLYMLGLAVFLSGVTLAQQVTLGDFALPPIGPARRGWIIALVGHVMSQGVVLASLLFVSRSYHRDVAILEPGTLPPTPSRAGYGVEGTAGVLAGYLLNLASANAMDGPNSSGTFFGPTSIWLGLDVTILLNGMLIVHLIATVYRQAHHLTQLAQRLQVSLMMVRAYAPFANPLLRTLAIAVATAALFSPGLLFPATSPVVLQVILPYLALSTLLLGIPLVLPVWLIDRRLRLRKLRELALIERALGGDQRALDDSGFAAVRQVDPQINLLAYEDKIARTWTLPVAPYLRSITLFALLPLMTWILAALVEVLVSGLLD